MRLETLDDAGKIEYKDQYGITLLYPIVGSITSVCGLSFLVKEIYNRIMRRTISPMVEPEKVRLHSFRVTFQQRSGETLRTFPLSDVLLTLRGQY